MKVIAGGRRSGKTFKAVEWVKQDPENRGLLVHNTKYAEMVREEYELTSEQVQTWQNPRRHRGLSREWYVDNLEAVLYTFLGPGIEGVTVTADVEALSWTNHLVDSRQ